MRPAQADALADIRRDGFITIGVFEDFPPFSSVGTDMSLHGCDVDFANAVAKSLSSIIGFDELLKTSNVINNATFAPFTIYDLVALIYFALCYPLTIASQTLERRLALATR